ncbi:hypothetical protein [Limisalsivibrio acetivorans]|uniref:phosphorylase family protein n=1 Tax=Limisalsivibrio acetivorans TaxID=1304888 RepID=UPI0003B79D75|nr:hypothetical protein [Limisalsivibrio acetivorans]
MLIIFPTKKEAKASIPNITLKGWELGILRGEYRGYDVIVTGVSKTNAAFASAIAIDRLKPQKALLAGICGSYKGSGYSPGDLLCLERDYFVDEGMMLPDGIRLIGEEGFPVTEGNCAEFRPWPKLPRTEGNTVSFLSSFDYLASAYRKKTGASVESMEGASVGLAAQRFGVECFHVRAVSNYCGERESQQWDIKKAFSALSSFFQSSL